MNTTPSLEALATRPIAPSRDYGRHKRRLLLLIPPLLLQLAFLAYSYTYRGSWLAHLDGSVPPGTYAGASKANWYLFRLGPPPPAGTALSINMTSPLPGLKFIHSQCVDLALLHMAWTLIPNCVALLPPPHLPRPPPPPTPSRPLPSLRLRPPRLPRPLP